MTRSNLARSVITLTVGNVFSALLGVATGLVVVRQLGPENFGLVGVVIAIMSVAANLLDFRIYDLLSRMIYGLPIDTPHRVQTAIGIVRTGLMLQSVLSLVIGCAGVAAALILLHLFIDQTATLTVLLAFAAAEAFSTLGGVLGFLQRFARRALAMASVQVGIAAMRAAIVCFAVLHENSVEAYAKAVVISSALSAMVNALFLLSLALRHASFAEIFRLEMSNISRFATELRFVAFANLSGYGKLLHRSVDVLVVGYFCSDGETGVYKFARSLTDTLYILYDAMYKAFQADMLAWLTRNAGESYRVFAKRLALTAAGGTLVVLAAEYWMLPPVLELIVGDRYLPAIPTILWLSVPVFFIFGIQFWLWPILVFHGRLSAYSGLQIMSVVLVQYGLPLVLFSITGAASPWLFALGYACSYVTVYVPLYLLERKAGPQFFPV
ncbi:MAG: oligosaccharide flippase family protein [Pseudomonadota bacterium]